MSSALSEKSEIGSDMTHTKNCNTVCEKKCNQLQYFKVFLGDFTKDAVSHKGNSSSEIGGCVNTSCNDDNGGGEELRSFIITRSNNESYSLTKNELSAEVKMCIWQWLIRKKCPEHFQFGVALLGEEIINKELKNKKVQEDIKTSSNKESSDELMIDLLKLHKFIHQQLEKVLLRLADNSKEENLKHIADCIKELECSPNATYNGHDQWVEAHIKNKHRKMEDRHICLPHFSQIYQLEESLSFYGVFDGHSGSLAATYATNQIPYRVAEELKSINNLSDLDSDSYREALETSFIQVDNCYGKKRLGSGTTAVCALLIRDNLQNFKHLYVAWVGDSRCLLVSPTVHLQLVKPHKPDSTDEKKRIESIETGGSVIFVQGQWRVNGIINVSRSIGDYSVKAVIAEPDIVDVPLQPSHDFLILGSDGLWDHLCEREIVDCVYKYLNDDEHCLEDIPKHLIELAKQGDSQDNITVILVFLKERKKIKEHFKTALNKLQ